MRRASESTEELILAAYLARDLPAELNNNVESYLLEFQEVTELVEMATSALENEMDATTEKTAVSLSWSILAFSVSLLLLAISSSTYVDAHDNSTPIAHVIEGFGEWRANVEPGIELVTWNSVPGATSYVLFIVNPENLQVVNMVRTTQTHISDLRDVADGHGLNSDGYLELWVVAFDENNGFIRSSPRTSFEANRLMQAGL